MRCLTKFRQIVIAIISTMLWQQALQTPPQTQSEPEPLPPMATELEAQEAELEEKVRSIMLRIPQMIDPSVPIGPDDSHNVEVQRFGDQKNGSDGGRGDDQYMLKRQKKGRLPG